MGNYSHDKKRFLQIQRQSRELIIPLASYYAGLYGYANSSLAHTPTLSMLQCFVSSYSFPPWSMSPLSVPPLRFQSADKMLF